VSSKRSLDGSVGIRVGGRQGWGPVYMRPELISGGNAPKSTIDNLRVPWLSGRFADVATDLAQRAGGFGDHRRGELEHVDLARPYLHFDRHAGGG
jgi:hypothetical protein